MSERQISNSLDRIAKELSELNRHMRVLEQTLSHSTTQTKSFNRISAEKKPKNNQTL